MDIGTGPWDRRGRPSEVRIDRVIRVDPTGVRLTSETDPAAIRDRLFARSAKPAVRR